MANREQTIPITCREAFERDQVFHSIRQLTADAHTLTEATFSTGPAHTHGPDRTLANYKVYQLPSAPFVLVMQHDRSVAVPEDAVSVRGTMLHLRTAVDAECSFEFPHRIDPARVRCELSSDGYLVITVPQQMFATHFDYYNTLTH